jgi:hypothetical protein
MEYKWPAFIRGDTEQGIPPVVHVRTGSLFCPEPVEPGDQAWMEQAYHGSLWPPLKQGFKRYTREFIWRGRTLLFRIIDIPGPTA